MYIYIYIYICTYICIHLSLSLSLCLSLSVLFLPKFYQVVPMFNYQLFFVINIYLVIFTKILPHRP